MALMLIVFFEFLGLVVSIQLWSVMFSYPACCICWVFKLLAAPSSYLLPQIAWDHHPPTLCSKLCVGACLVCHAIELEIVLVIHDLSCGDVSPLHDLALGLAGQCAS